MSPSGKDNREKQMLRVFDSRTFSHGLTPIRPLLVETGNSRGRTRLGRRGRRRDPVLASDEASYVTGALPFVDGGVRVCEVRRRASDRHWPAPRGLRHTLATSPTCHPELAATHCYNCLRRSQRTGLLHRLTLAQHVDADENRRHGADHPTGAIVSGQPEQQRKNRGARQRTDLSE
jgi:hypothetical protein